MATFSTDRFRSDSAEAVAERVRRLLGPPPDPDRRPGLLDDDPAGDPDGPLVGGFEFDDPRPERDPGPARHGRRSPARSARSGWSGWSGWRERWPVRVDPGRRGAIAMGAAVLVVLIVVVGWLVTSRPRALAIGTSGAAGAAPVMTTPSGSAAAPSTLSVSSTTVPATVSGTAGPTSAAAMLVVDVAGKVAHPGVYRLPSGSRVDDAVQAAGGARAGVDLTDLNLAALLTDGEQVAVGRAGAAAVTEGGAPLPDASGTGGGDAASGGTVVDINTATLEQLETLPRVGPVMGQKIIDWRTAHNGFSSVDQLNEVSGIGDVTFAGLRPLVSV